MATLKYIREVNDSGLLLLGIVGEEESVSYTVNTSLYLEIGSPSVGDNIDSVSLSAIAYSDELYRARKKALNILAYADNNKRNMMAKLLRGGFKREICEKVCLEMISHGYINEKNQLERLIIVEANQKLRGPMRIIPALASKGYSSGDIREVLNRLTSDGDVDFQKNAMRLIEKKLPPDADEGEINKLLYKNGYRND